MNRKPRQLAGAKDAAPAARLELNRRHRAINDSGVMAGMNSRAWRVFSYALAHADFETCRVYLGAKTVAAKAFGGIHNRTAARVGIARLVDAGVLEIVPEASTNWKTVYEIRVPVGAYPSCPPGGTPVMPPGGDTRHAPNPSLERPQDRSREEKNPGRRTEGVGTPPSSATEEDARAARLKRAAIVPKRAN